MTYHEEQTKGIVKRGNALLFNVRLLNVEATGGEDDGEGEPEAAIGGEGSGAESVADGHFPVVG